MKNNKNLRKLLNTNKKNGVTKSSTLKRIQKLENVLAQYPEISNTSSIADLTKGRDELRGYRGQWTHPDDVKFLDEQLPQYDKAISDLQTQYKQYQTDVSDLTTAQTDYQKYLGEVQTGQKDYQKYLGEIDYDFIKNIITEVIFIFVTK